MKKIFLLFMLFVFTTLPVSSVSIWDPVPALDGKDATEKSIYDKYNNSDYNNERAKVDNVYIDMELPTDEKIESQMGEVFALLDKAKQTNDLELYFRACEKGYKQKKEGNAQNIKKYNDALSAFAIEYSLQRYQITKDKKLFERAYKWSKIAVNDRTSQVYSIRADILLASMFLEPNEMKKAYDLYRAVDIDGAQNFYSEYEEALVSTNEYIKDKSANRKAKWVRGLKVVGLSLCGGLAAFGQGVQNYNARHQQTHCYSIGNSVYCDSY